MAYHSTELAPMHVAAANGQVDNLVRLLEKGELIDATDNRGNTPLIVAATNGHAEAVSTLLKHGANPNMRNYCGEAALMLAAAAGQPVVASLLIESSADVHAKNWWGETAEVLARRAGQHELVALLQKQHSKITYGQPSRVDDLVVQEDNKLVPTDGTKCWFCENATHEPGMSRNVTLFASMADHGGSQSDWSKLTVAVPICKGCDRLDNRLSSWVAWATALFAVGGFIAALILYVRVVPSLFPMEVKNAGAARTIAVFILGGIMNLAVAFCVVAGGTEICGFSVYWGAKFFANRTKRRAGVKNDSALQQYPLIRQFVQDGWHVGDKPPKAANATNAAPQPTPATETATTRPAPAVERATDQRLQQTLREDIEREETIKCGKCGRAAPIRYYGRSASGKPQVTLIGPDEIKKMEEDNIALKCQDCGFVVCYCCAQVKIGSGSTTMPRCPSCGKVGGPYLFTK